VNVPFRQGHLRYFVTVADEEQITRAARKLNIAQPALSQAMAQLEADVGFALFERHPRGVALTPAGRAFYEQARRAVQAAEEAEQTGGWLTRSAEGTLEFGFVGSPPGLDSPGQIRAFADAHPGIDFRYRELPFPTLPTSRWIADVDIAVCHAPPPDEGVWEHPVRRESRAVLAPKQHHLAARDAVSVADVLDETFIGLHPDVAPEWAGFWSLDDHRGGPPRSRTQDRAANPHEVLAALAVRDAITTVPSSVAAVLLNVLSGIVTVPVTDGAPCTIMLVGHADRRNPLVASVLAFARGVAPEEAVPQSAPLASGG
jgi:DNA-binding transcriptional LysR family regulator